jgi:hypothetical protein
MRDDRGEPVEVWLRDGRPARFVWRARLYTVLFVVDKRIAAETQAAMDDMAAADTAPRNVSVQPLPGRSEYWLVEAVPERATPASRFELHHDPATDRWSLTRS